jgi:hypothetical protein
VVEPPRLRPEPLRRSEPGNPGKSVSHVSLCWDWERHWGTVGRGLLTAFPGGRPG